MKYFRIVRLWNFQRISKFIRELIKALHDPPAADKVIVSVCLPPKIIFGEESLPNLNKRKEKQNKRLSKKFPQAKDRYLRSHRRIFISCLFSFRLYFHLFRLKV